MTNTRYFRVKNPIKIANHRFLPCVSYSLNRDLIATIEMLVAQDKAEISDTPFVFETGKVITKEVPQPHKRRTKKEIFAEIEEKL